MELISRDSFWLVISSDFIFSSNCLTFACRPAISFCRVRRSLLVLSRFWRVLSSCLFMFSNSSDLVFICCSSSSLDCARAGLTKDKLPGKTQKNVSTSSKIDDVRTLKEELEIIFILKRWSPSCLWLFSTCGRFHVCL